MNSGRVMAKRSGMGGVTGAHLRRPNEDADGAQHVQPDEHEAGASSSSLRRCDARHDGGEPPIASRDV